MIQNNELVLSSGHIASFIPYIKEWRRLPLVKTINDAILMYQLEEYFTVSPKGFSKFLAPNSNITYEENMSWIDVLAMSADEFRTAFGHIGIAHCSKKTFDSTDDKFKGKYYCSYHDRITHQTFYSRNNSLISSHLSDLISRQKQKTLAI